MAAVSLLGAALGAVVHAAGASSVGSRQPLAVQTASLVQQGQHLVWQVELAQPFSPGVLRRDRRSVCLLIERAANGSVAVTERIGLHLQRFAEYLSGIYGHERLEAVVRRDVVGWRDALVSSGLTSAPARARPPRRRRHTVAGTAARLRELATSRG